MYGRTPAWVPAQGALDHQRQRRWSRVKALVTRLDAVMSMMRGRRRRGLSLHMTGESR